MMSQRVKRSQPRVVEQSQSSVGPAVSQPQQPVQQADGAQRESLTSSNSGANNTRYKPPTADFIAQLKAYGMLRRQQLASPILDKYRAVAEIMDMPTATVIRILPLLTEDPSLSDQFRSFTPRNLTWDQCVQEIKNEIETVSLLFPLHQKFIGLRQENGVPLHQYNESYAELMRAIGEDPKTTDVSKKISYLASLANGEYKNRLVLEMSKQEAVSLLELMKLGSDMELLDVRVGKRILEEKHTGLQMGERSKFRRTEDGGKANHRYGDVSANHVRMYENKSNSTGYSNSTGKWRNKEDIDKLRAQGLCFKCREPWSREHKCNNDNKN